MRKKKSSPGILLDLGCGGNKQGPQWIGMDKRDLPGVDIVHDLEKFPYPLKDNSVLSCVCSHVLEHIKPWYTLDVFNEMWRIMSPGGRWAINVPYAGSHGFWQDPTHCNGFVETTFYYFDPQLSILEWDEVFDPQRGWVVKKEGQPNGLYNIYSPKPWKILPGFPAWQANGNLEVILEKRRLK